MTKASRRGRRPGQTQEPRRAGTPSTVEALSAGLVRLARVTFATGLDAARDVGSELRTAGVRTMRGSITAARDIGGDLAMVGREVSAALRGPAKPAVKAPGRRRRRPAA